MFAVVAVVAVVLFSLSAFRAIRTSRFNYSWARYEWQMQKKKIGEVIVASESLMNAESTSIWISRTTATRNHLDRLKELLGEGEALIPLAQHPDEKDYWDGENKSLRAEILKVSRRLSSAY
jgi:hypothetical protein